MNSNGVVVLQIVCVVVCLCTGCNGYESLQWSETCSTDFIHSSYYGLSLPQCYEQCARRTACSYFQYRTQFHLCELCGNESNNSIFDQSSRSNTSCLRGVPSAPDFGKPQFANTGLSKCNPNPCMAWELCSSSLDSANITCLITDCTPPTETQNVAIMGNTNRVGSRIVYRCLNGSSGSNHTTTLNAVCNANGIWSPGELRCFFDCPAPPTITNAHASTNGFAIPVYTNVTYTCINGSSSPLPVIVTCTPDEQTFQGYWTTPSSHCLPDCGSPFVQSATILNSTIGSSYPAGSVLQYSCLAGLIPTATQTLACNTTGHWEASSACSQGSCTGSLASLYEFDQTYGICYMFYDSILTAAFDICNTFEGTLLGITSDRDKQFMKHVMNVKNSNNIYVGPRSQYDNSNLADWAMGQPAINEDCVQVQQADSSYLWSVVDCTNTLYYIIIKDV